MSELLDIKTELGTALKMDIEGYIYSFDEKAGTWENTKLKILDVDKSEFQVAILKKKNISL